LKKHADSRELRSVKEAGTEKVGAELDDDRFVATATRSRDVGMGQFRAQQDEVPDAVVLDRVADKAGPAALGNESELELGMEVPPKRK
jgi:hypothetical protein